MSIEFALPELGENIEKGDVTRVLVNVGDMVKKDQPVVELETDKATIEVPSSVQGKVSAVRVKVGDKVKVGQAVLVLEETAEAPAPKATPAAAPKAAEAPKPAAAAAPEPAKPEAARAAEPEKPAGKPAPVVDITTGRPATSASPAAAVPSTDAASGVPAAPSVRRYARELGVEIAQVEGSGPGGRIGQDDVKEHVKTLLSGSGGPMGQSMPLPDFTKWGDVEVAPMSNIRRKTAEHLSWAWQAPHVTQHDKADMTALENFRKTYGARVEKAGAKLTVTVVLLKIVTAALDRFPQFASSLDLANNAIVMKRYRHVGVAVDTTNGLLVPVIRDVDRKTMTGLAVELTALSQKAQNKKLSLDEMAGGVFTISNLGGIGGTAFTPLINPPEVAILGVSRGAFEPVWRDGEFEPRQLLPLSLSYDHRVIDGADAARFLRFVAEAIEQPLSMDLEPGDAGSNVEPSMSSTQLVVIGAGPGGYAAAFYAADMGLQVSMVDTEVNPGGVCLYRGCIPSKALLHVAKLIGEAKHASAWGIEFGEPKIDLDKLRGFKDAVVKKLTGGLGQITRQRKVNYIQGRASFKDATTLSIEQMRGGIETLTFEHAIIATGSRPTTVPGLSIDSPRVMDSTGGLDLPDIPKSLLVVGGGYIGLELGSVYAALGTKVTVVEMTAGLLPGADRDLVNVLAKRLGTTLSKVMLNARVVDMKDVKNGVKVRIEGEGLTDADKDQTFDRVLVSIGRKPNSAIPGLEKTRVKTRDRGFIAVDAAMRTDEPKIFAIGDVVGEPMLAHKASHEARVAVEAAMGHKVAFEPQAIPAVVFTDPEVAWCGLTETDAQKQGRRVEIAKFPWAAIGRAVAIDRTDGLTKLVIDPDTERILGVGIVGAGAGELIAEGVLAIEMAALATDLKLTIHPHPTLSETLMEAAEVFFGQATDVYKPKRK